MSEPEKLERGLGLIEATSLNMTFMVGIGPFIVIPFIVQAMGGPQCILAWVSGRGAGGAGRLRVGGTWARRCRRRAGVTFFCAKRTARSGWGRLMSFLYIWQTLFQAPLSISSGALGFADYSNYLDEENLELQRGCKGYGFRPDGMVGITT